MTEPIDVFLVDDHAVVRKGIRALLETKSSLRIVGEAENGKEAIEKACELKPQIIMLDINLPDVNGLEVAKILREKLPNSRLIALSMHNAPEYIQSFLEAGGSGYLPKTILDTQLLDAVAAVARGEHYLPPQVLTDLAKEIANPNSFKQAKLTKRELDVVQYIAQGSTYKEIANILGISEKTVATYRERAAGKLGIKSRVELVRWALEQKLLS